MKILRYKVSIESNIKRNLKNFKKDIDNILSHKKSWKVNFIQDDTNFDFEIILASANNVAKYCNFEGLSCADTWNNIVYINNYRWTKGAKPSQLSLKDYRIYLINHEVGHILGFGHAKPIKNKKAPVMNQHTLGLKGGLPYQWPLPSEQLKLKKLLIKNL